MPSLGANNPSSNLAPNASSPFPSTDSLINRRPAVARRWQNSSEEDSDDPRGKPIVGTTLGPEIDVDKSLDEIVSSPDQTPSFISVEERMKWRLRTPKETLVERMGRDFGGSASGNTSLAGSDTEFSAEENQLTLKERMEGRTRANDEKNIAERQDGRSRLGIPTANANGRTSKLQKGRARGAMADALGDHSDGGGSDGDGEGDGEGGEADTEDLEEAERKDKSVKGSVY